MELIGGVGEDSASMVQLTCLGRCRQFCSYMLRLILTTVIERPTRSCATQPYTGDALTNGFPQLQQIPVTHLSPSESKPFVYNELIIAVHHCSTWIRGDLTAMQWLVPVRWN